MDAIRQLIDRLRAQITEIWGRMERKDRNRFLIITGASLLVIIIAVVVLNQPNYVSLYSETLETAATAEITAQLDAMGERYKLSDPGTILVPERNRDRLFVALASTSTGLSSDLTIFQMGTGMVSNDYQQRMYAKFQTESSLRRAIMLNKSVRDAQVLINIPDNNSILFKEERKDITASVTLYMQPGMTLEDTQIQSIENQVAYAVGMSVENVSIMDDSFSLLNRRKDGVYSDSHDLEQKVAQDFKRELSPMLNAVFGSSRYRLGVNVGLQWDEETEHSVVYTPVVDENGIVRSMRTTSEIIDGGGTTGGEAGFDENGGDVSEYPEVTGTGASHFEKITTETNYEINEIIKDVKNSPGKEITHLSVSVVVDNENLSTLNQSATADNVRNMIGATLRLDPAQYASYVAVNFQEFEGVKAEAALRQQQEDAEKQRQMWELIKFIIVCVLIAGCVIVLILQIMGLFRRKHDDEERARAEADAARLAAEREAMELAGLAGLTSVKAPGPEIEEKKSPERERIEEFIEKNPDAVAQLLRTWLAEEPEKRRR